MNISEIASENVRALLQVRGLSLRQLSGRIGASPSTLSDAMRSRHGLSVDHLAAIAEVFQVSVDALCSPAFDPTLRSAFSSDYAGYAAARARLDAHGKKLVDTVLAMELERCSS